MAEAGHVLLDVVTVILRVAVNDRNKLKLHIERLAGLRAQRKLLISLSQGLDHVMMFSPHNTTNLTTYQDPNHMPGYAGYCPRAKFLYYGDTFGNTTAKCFQDRRTAKLSTSITHDPGISADGQHRFPTVYSNTPDLVLSASARTRERWRNAKKYSLFNEHQRGREVQEFDKISQNHRNHYMDRTGTVQRVERFVMPRKEPIVARRMNGAENSSLLRKDFKIKSPLCGIFVSEEDKDFRSHHNHPFKMSPPSTYTWRDRALRDIYFEKR